MNTDDITKLVNDIITLRLKEYSLKENSFRSVRKFDSVTDQYSPITGASQQIGFMGTSKVSKQTVTGSKGANAALTSLLTALSNYGLITDSTT